MAFKAVPNLLVSDNGGPVKAGYINNCLIYSFNMNMGVGEAKTTCSLNIVTARGKYPDFSKRLSYLNPYVIKLGKMKPMKMFLVSAKDTHSVDQKTMQLDFVDGSHILDRIYIGLINRHDRTLMRDASGNPVEPETPVNVYQQEVGFTTPILCQPCDPYNLPKTNTVKNITPSDPKYGHLVKRKNDHSLLKHYGNNKIGGFIIVGKEKYAENDCALKDVDYNFTELKLACSLMKVNLVMTDIRPEFRTSYVGTLREVLTKWSADFGISWSFDYFNDGDPTVYQVGNNSKKTNVKINKIANLAKNIKSTNATALVENVEHEISIKDTYKQYIVTSYKKPKQKKEDATTTYYRSFAGNVGIKELFDEEFLDGRTHEQFIISCCLAKWKPELRTLYLLSINSFQPLGFKSSIKASPTVKKEIIDQCLNTDTYLDFIDYIAGVGASAADIKDADFDMMLGTYSKQLEDAYLQWERNVAESFGKYYYTTVVGNDWTYCPDGADYKYISKTSLSPDAKFYYGTIDTQTKKICRPSKQVLSSASQSELSTSQTEKNKVIITNKVQNDLPFTELLRGPMGENIFADTPVFNSSSTNGSTPTKKIKGSQYVRIFERSNAAWSQKQTDWDCQFNNPLTGESLLARYMPHYQKIVGSIKTKIMARYASIANGITSFIDGTSDDSEPVLMIVPQKKRLDKLLGGSNSIQLYRKNGKIAVVPNANESQNTYKEQAKNLKKQKSCENTALCEQQSNLIAEVCDCSGVNVPPKQLASGAIYDSSKEKFAEGIYNNESIHLLVYFNPDPIARTVQKPNGSYTKEYDVFQAALGTTLPVGSSSLLNEWSTVSGKRTLSSFDNSSLYQINYIEDLKRTKWTQRVLKVLNDFNNPIGNVGGVRVVDNDVTQQLSAFDTSATSRVVNVFVPPTVNTAGNPTALGSVQTMEDYHKLMRILNNTGTEEPKSTLSVALGSYELGELLPFCQVQDGLSSLNLTISDSGSSASISWTSGLSLMPAQDIVMSQVVPRAKYSLYTS